MSHNTHYVCFGYFIFTIVFFTNSFLMQSNFCNSRSTGYLKLRFLWMLLTSFILHTSWATTTSLVETSKRFIIPTVTIEITAGARIICAGTSVTFTATPTDGGLTPTYQWKKNGVNVGNNAAIPTFTSATLNNADVITCVMTSSDPNTNPNIVISNGITMSVDASTRPAMNPVPNQTLCAGTNIAPITFTGTGVNAYVWTSNNDSTGIATNGVNHIAPFVTRNVTSMPITSTITVTPKNGSNGFFYVSSSPWEVVAFDKQNQIVARIPIRQQIGYLAPLVVSPTGNRVYVADSYPSGILSVLNTTSQSVVNSLPLGGHPKGIAISPDGNRLYVTKRDSGLVSVINTNTYEVVATIPVGLNSWPVGVAVSPNGSRVYVANHLSMSVSVINAVTNTLITTIPISMDMARELYGVSRLVVSPDGSKVYVSNSVNNSVAVINTATNTVSNTIIVGNNPQTLAITPNGNRLYVCNVANNTVSVINTLTNTVMTTVPVGEQPVGVSATPDGTAIYVINQNTNSVSVINTTTNTVTTTFGVSNPVSNGDAFMKTTQSYCEGVPTTFSITVLPTDPPTVTVGITAGAQTTCSQQPITFEATTQNAGVTTTYQWFKNGNLISGATNRTYTGSQWANNDSITCQIRTNTVCPTVASGVIAVSPAFIVNLTANIVGNNAGCDSVLLTASGGVRYQWSGGATPNSATNIFSTNGNYTVTVTDITGCSSIVSKTVTILTLPTLNAVGNLTRCTGDSVSIAPFIGTGAPRLDYNWTNNNPFIGLAASGTGHIPAFKAENQTSTPITATFTAAATSDIPDWAYMEALDTLLVVNPVTQTVVTSIPLNAIPYGVTVSPEGSKVYITYEQSDIVSVLHTARNLIANIPLGSIITCSTLSPDGNRFYVGTRFGNSVKVVNTVTNQVIASIPWQGIPSSIVVSPDNRKIYVADGSSNIFVIDAATNTVISTLPTAYLPKLLALTPDGNRLYVGSNDDLFTVQLATQMVTNLLPFSGTIYQMLLSPNGSRLYLRRNGNTEVINTANHTFVARLPQGELSINRDGSLLYIIGFQTLMTVNTSTHMVSSTFSSPYRLQVSGNYIRSGQTGCIGNTTTFTLTVNPKPAVSIAITAGTLPACNNNSITLTATPTFSGANPIFQWYKNGIAIHGATHSTYTSAVWADNDSIACVMTSPNVTCPTTVSSSKIGIPTIFHTSITGATVGCGSVQLTAWGGVSYLWSAGATPNAATNRFTTSGTYQVTITNANGCVATESRTITVSPTLVTINPLQNRTVCAGSRDTIPPFTSTNGTGYSWTNDHPEIGILPNGSGNMGSFTATNTTQSDITATISAVATSRTVEYAYIPNFNSHNISVIHTGTNTVVATIPLHVDDYPYVVCVSPNGDRVYVGNRSSDKVSVINTATNTVIARISLVPNPLHMVVSPNGSKIYVSSYTPSIVSVIDAATYSVTRVANMTADELCVNPEGTLLYMATGIAQTISVVNTAANVVQATIPMANGANPTSLASNSDGSLLYVANSGLNQVAVINVRTQLQIKTIPITGVPPYTLCLSPDGSRLYALGGNLNIINTATDSVVGTIFSLGGSSISVSSDNRRLYLPRPNTNNVIVVNALTHAITDTIDVGLQPHAIGRFILPTRVECESHPTTFTITVQPTTPPTVSIAANPGNVILRGTAVTFTATPTRGGIAPSFQWKKNGNNVGTNRNTYTDISLVHDDLITCVLTSNAPCITQQTVTSTAIRISVLNYVTPAVTIETTSGSTTVCSGASVWFRAIVTNGGATPAFQWKKNGLNVGTNRATFNQSNWVTGDVITCELTNNEFNALPSTVTSNRLTLTVTNIATIQPIANQIWCAGVPTTPVEFTGNGITTFSWTNDNTAIGLGQNGLGNIGSFSAVNSTGAPLTATITATNSNPEYAYIPAVGSDSVWVIHTGTRAIVAIIPVGAGPSGVAISPDGSRAYITNFISNNVSVINTRNQTVIKTINVGNNPEGIAVTPSGDFVYVGNNSSNDVSVISTILDSVIATIPVGRTPEGLEMSPDGSKLYVSNANSDNISVINTTTNTVVSTIATNSTPDGMAISANGLKLYVANWGSSQIEIINTVTNTISESIRVEARPHGVALNPSNTRLYVVNHDSNSVSVIHTGTSMVLATIRVGESPYCVSVSSDGSQAYVTNSGSNSVSVINTVTNTVMATIPIGIEPYSIGPFIKPAISGFCSVTAPVTFSVTVNPSVTASVSIGITAGHSTTCSNSAITFAATPTQGGVTPTYQWYKNGLAIVGATSAFYTGANWANADVISCAMTSNATCPLPATVTSNRITITTAGIVGTATDCSNVLLTAVGGNTYQWSGGATPNTAANTFTTSGTYTVTVTGTGGCVSIISQFVRVMTPPIMQPIANQVFCEGSNVSLLPFTGSPDTAIYFWTNDNPNIGLESAGLGNIPSFVGQGGTAHFTVTPFVGSPEYAYITYDNGVAVMDTRTNLKVRSITVGIKPYGVSVRPDGRFVYVTNQESNSVSVISTATQTVIATIPVGSSPTGISAGADNSRVYVANRNDNTISVINTSTHTVIATIPIRQNLYPTGVWANPNGNSVYVTNESGRVTVINPSTNQVVTNISVQRMPTGLITLPSGNRLYVTNKNSNTVSVVDTRTNTVLTTISVGISPSSIAVSADGRRVYVVNESSISVIDAETNALVSTIPSNFGITGISVTGDGNQLYVTNRNGGNYPIQVINTLTNTATNLLGYLPGATAFGNFMKPSFGSCLGTSRTFSISSNSRPFAGFTPIFQAGSGSIVNFNNSSSAGAMLWHFGDTLNSTSTEVHPTFWYQKNGLYHIDLQVTSAAGCRSSSSYDLTVNRVRTGLNELSEPWSVTVSPNPFSETLQLSIDNQSFTLSGNEQLMVTNGIGQLVYQTVLTAKTLELNTQFWAEGIYNLTLSLNGQRIPLKKMVKYVR